MAWFVWAVLGAVACVAATFAECALVTRLLHRTPWQRYQPSGPGYGVTLMWFAPGAGALVWALWPPTVAPMACLYLTVGASLVCTWFAASTASD